MKIKKNLETGIAQVQKANTFINKLSNEISEKEPEILKLSTEIEQFNKRLSQERINLERASKAFRKKEVLARKKGEETQELAADGKKMLNVLCAVGDTFLCAVKLSFKYCLQKLFPHPSLYELKLQLSGVGSLAS